jgi:putative ABC transport system permease protein
MGPQEITSLSLGVCLLLLLIPLGLNRFLRLDLARSILISVLRMIVQLFLMGFYLTLLFRLNNELVNVAWVLVMVVAASFTVIKNSELSSRLMLGPVFTSLLLSVFCMLLYFTGAVLRLERVLEAKYFVVIGGMFLGNSLRGNIIGLSNFYQDINRNKQRYQYRLAAGATVFEAALPHIRRGLRAALRPMIATMATMGLVFLPGMMTGQILGGASPNTAIAYQIAIMSSIFVLSSVTVILSITFSLRRSFDSFGNLREDLFRKKR